MEIEKLLQNPTMEHRDVLVWAINGRTNNSELKRQIEIFAKMGVSGVCLRAGTGLADDFFGEEWMLLVKFCVAELKTHGLKAYLCDDDRYVSGVCGGLATMNPRFRAKSLTYERVPYNKFSFSSFHEGFVAAYGIRTVKENDEEKLGYYYKINNSTEIRKGDEIMVVSVSENGREERFNGGYGADYLNSEAFEYFMSLRMKKYSEELSGEFGDTIAGVFTMDCVEELFGKDNAGKLRRPYTYEVEKEFFDVYGFKLISRLPELFFLTAGEDFSSISMKYGEVVKRLYERNRLLPYIKWCNDRGLTYCGCFTGGNSLTSACAKSGDRMRMLAHMDEPIISVPDDTSALFRNVEIASVKSQMGKKYATSDVFSGLGLRAGFSDFKTAIDEQAFLGINRRFLDVALYTLAEEAKRTEGCIGAHSTCYEDFRLVSDYGARLNCLNSVTTPGAKVLVLYGTETSAGTIGKFRQDLQNKNFTELCTLLVDNNIDFDLGNEEIISKNCQVKGWGKNATLAIGQAKYTTVFVVGMMTIRKTTLKELTKFVRRGGSCVFTGEVPTRVEGMQVEFNKFPLYSQSKIRATDSSILSEAPPSMLKEIACEENDICLKVRNFEDGDKFVFALNRNGKTARKAHIVFDGEYIAYKINLISGKEEEIDFETSDGETVVQYEFCPAGELAIRLQPTSAADGEKKSVLTKKKEYEKARIPVALDYKLSEPNVLVLDVADVTINDKNKGVAEIISAADYIRQTYGLTKRGGIQPWYNVRILKKDTNAKVGNLELAYTFFVKDKPMKMRLAMEKPDMFEIFLNGRRVPLSKEGAFVDVALEKVVIPSTYVLEGKNELVLKCELTDETPIEPIYLVGNFGVSVQNRENDFDVCEITALPEKLEIGDITKQGLPFYGGKIYYYVPLGKGRYEFRFEGKRPWVMARLRTTEANVPVPFAPFTAQIDAGEAEKDYLRVENVGENSVFESESVQGVQIEVSLSRCNTFGSLHYDAPCGRSSRFGKKTDEFSRSAVIKENGLLGLVVRKLPEKQ